MRISFWSARAHLILTCACALLFCLCTGIAFLPAHAHRILTCACTSHLHLLLRISFWPAHAHLILACSCASHFCLRMRTFFKLRMRISFWSSRLRHIYSIEIHPQRPIELCFYPPFCKQIKFVQLTSNSPGLYAGFCILWV